MWARGFEYPLYTLSRLCALFHVGAWCSDVLFEFRFRVGVRKLTLHVLLQSTVSSSLGPHAPVRVCCCVLCSTRFVFGRMLSRCLVLLHAARGSLGHVLSCFVWTRGLWVFSLSACWCLVLHMAGDLFCWPCACVLCEHMAFVFVFCVPCALMSIVLTAPPSCYLVIQVTWFICPHLSSLVTLFILLVCAVLCQFVVECTLVVSSLVGSCLAVQCPVLS